MKAAIIGAGLAGLATCHYLFEEGEMEVTVFDSVGIGAGASGVCSGLLHPYAGLAAKRSHRATDALNHTKELLKIAEAHTPHLVSQKNGIYRRAVSEEQKRQLQRHAEQWGDVEEIEDGLFLIHSGITVNPEAYLRGLWTSLEKRGASFQQQKIGALSDLDRFDAVVVACGWGVQAFPECACLTLSFVKGQSLRMKGQSPHTKSYIEKGYIAHLGDAETFDLGATYERDEVSDRSDLATATALLQKRHPSHLRKENILSCRAGVRVSTAGSRLPIAEKLSDRLFVFTGLGSRGLLYHALYGSILSKKICMS